MFRAKEGGFSLSPVQPMKSISVYPELDDAVLMCRVCDDDAAAFEVLVKRHQKKLLNYFLRAGVHTDGEDLVQQTFLRLYRYRKRYQPRARVTTFLFLMARQVWIDALRRRKRYDRLKEGIAADAVDASAAPAAADAAAAGGLDVAQALATLPEAMRQVVELGVYQDLPYAEIAAILGIPVGTVKSRMFHALARLRAYLEEE